MDSAVEQVHIFVDPESDQIRAGDSDPPKGSRKQKNGGGLPTAVFICGSSGTFLPQLEITGHADALGIGMLLADAMIQPAKQAPWRCVLSEW